MSTAPVNAPTTSQLVAAMASALLPLAGPTGLAVSLVIPAAEQLIATLRGSGKANYTLEELAAIVAEGNAELATLRANVEKLP